MGILDKYDIANNLIDDETLYASDSHLVGPVALAQRQFTRLLDMYRHEARAIATEMEASIARVEAGGLTGNGLGVLQSKGAALDRMCGEIDVLADVLVSLVAAWHAEHGTATDG